MTPIIKCYFVTRFFASKTEKMLPLLLYIINIYK